MAEAEPWLSRIPCRYYSHGICRAGDNCHYSHDQAQQSTAQDEGAPSPNSRACRFYLRGCCTYGAKCRFEHTDQGPSASSSAELTKPWKEKPNHGNRPMNATKNRSGSPSSKMVVLKKGSRSADSNDSGIDMDVPSTSSPMAATKPKKPEDWVKAAEFVPGQPYRSQGIGTYSQVASSGTHQDEANSSTYQEAEEEMRGGFPVPAEPVTEESKKLICPFAAHGECRYGENCTYTHGDICDLCFLPCLHPTDDELRKKHREDCMAEIEKDMEESFAFQRSKEMSCGVCMEVIMEKEPPSERRFGILSHCCHCFCLSCIRKWRQAKQFENKVVRACPECRKTSDFVTPSEYWVETPEEKDKLIQGYKKALGQKACKYFDQGRGECPFNERCFYRHALPDGTIVEAKPRPRRRRQNADGETDAMPSIFLWDFMEERDMLYDLFVSDILEELMFPSYDDSDSDDSDDFYENFASFHL